VDRNNGGERNTLKPPPVNQSRKPQKNPGGGMTGENQCTRAEKKRKKKKAGKVRHQKESKTSKKRKAGRSPKENGFVVGNRRGLGKTGK